MARKSGKDRGLYSRRWSNGTLMWYVRCAVDLKYRRFGPFDSKDLAREIYNKTKLLNATGMPINTGKPKLLTSNDRPHEFGPCIYFVQCGTGGPVKIGYTRQLATRLKAIHHLNGGGVRFLGAVAGSIESERRLHEKYKDERLHGEWFKLSHRLLVFLCGAGMKPTIAIEATRELIETFSLLPSSNASTSTTEQSSINVTS